MGIFPAPLTRLAEGRLPAAPGGQNGAGIGSRGGSPSPGKILIRSGTIDACGGEKAAGIGDGLSSPLDKANNIVIDGGSVRALPLDPAAPAATFCHIQAVQ